jgi:hypothetical protein
MTKRELDQRKKDIVIRMVFAVSDAIRELREVPSGHLYAQVMGFVSLQEYQMILDILTGAGAVKVENHLITWMGGAK